MDFTTVVSVDQLPLLAFATATLIGIVNVTQMSLKQVTGLYAFLLSVVLGVGAGFLNLYGLTPQLGLLAALSGSGIYKLTQVNGGK